MAFDRATATRFAAPWGRRLAYALAASLLLHGVLLLPGVNVSVPAQELRTVQAVLQPPRTADVPLAERVLQAASSAVARAAPPARDEHPVASSDGEVNASSVRPAAAKVPVPETDGVDGDGLRAYRIALAVAARRQRPAVSALGLAGRADLRVAVDAAGARVSIATSSGQAELDAAALQLLRLAVADAALPASLRGQAFAVEVPVLFGAAP